MNDQQPHLNSDGRSYGWAAVVIVLGLFAALAVIVVSVTGVDLPKLDADDEQSQIQPESGPPSTPEPGSRPQTKAGRWSKPFELGKGGPQSTTAIAVNSAGQAIAAWGTSAGIRVARGGPGGFERSEPFGPGERPAVAIDAEGNSYVVWTGGGATLSTFLRTGEAISQARIAQLSDGAAQLGAEVVATPVSGAVAAWRETVPEGIRAAASVAGPRRALAAGRPISKPAHLLNNLNHRIGLAAGNTGVAAAAWVTSPKDTIDGYRLFVARGSTGDGGMDDGVLVSPDSTTDQADVTVGPKEQVVTVWVRYDDEQPTPYPHHASKSVYYSYMGEDDFGAAGKGPEVSGDHFLFGPQAFIDAEDNLVIVWTNNDAGRHAGPLYSAWRAPEHSFSEVASPPQPNGVAFAKDPLLRSSPKGGAMLAWEENPDSRAAKFGVATYAGDGRFEQVDSPDASPVSNGLGIGNRDFAVSDRHAALIWRQRGGPVEASIYRPR